jgi:hypothetical protein
MVGAGRPSTSLAAKGWVFLLLSDWPQAFWCEARKWITEGTERFQRSPRRKAVDPALPLLRAPPASTPRPPCQRCLQSHPPARPRSGRAVIDKHRIKGGQTRGWSACADHDGRESKACRAATGQSWDKPAMTVERTRPTGLCQTAVSPNQGRISSSDTGESSMVTGRRAMMSPSPCTGSPGGPSMTTRWPTTISTSGRLASFPKASAIA